MEFITVAKLLNAISQRIELPDNWDELIGLPEPTERPADSSVPQWKRLQNVDIRIIRASLASDYQYSAAARGLDMVLVNYVESRPPWYDLKDTGAAKKNPSCQSEVEQILVGIANVFDSVLDCLQRTGVVWESFRQASSIERARSHSKRLQEVGFYYHDLKPFFAAIPIDNPFEDEQVEQENSLEVGRVGAGNTKRVYSTKGQRIDLLAPVIEKVIAEIQQDTTAAVFLALREKAERGESVFTMVEGEALKCKKWAGLPDRLTKKALGARLARRRTRLCKL
ncbi:hypothetical protein [Chromobacterium sp. CV08]|uniref:hypothetical protein n=1 Tax=Chromobacterium sp. CV08 TaxID=3133274 RepID=UPI003DA9DD5D